MSVGLTRYIKYIIMSVEFVLYISLCPKNFRLCLLNCNIVKYLLNYKNITSNLFAELSR